MESAKHHIIISGTGRAGTTFLVQLLTQLGLDTGFAYPDAKVSALHHGGMEWDLRKEKNAPYIVKSPALCEHLAGLLKESNLVIDHAIIPVRDLYSAAESRREVARKGEFKFLTPLRRGFRRIRRPDLQETVLAQDFYHLIYTIAQHNIPMTLLHFPRLATDPHYLFDRMNFMFPHISFEQFSEAFRMICKPSLIHDFTSRRLELATSCS